MELELDHLNQIHPQLPLQIALLLQTRAGLALQRRGHQPGVLLLTRLELDDFHDLLKWTQLDINELALHDVLRVTEDGAEGIALVITGRHLGWKLLRRLQREESADWLLKDSKGALMALEVSGVDRGSAARRLTEKLQQVRKARDVDQRWAAVVSFEDPTAALMRAD